MNTDSISYLETDRMLLDRLCEEDYPFLRLLHQDPKVMETLGGVRTEAQTHQNLAWNLQLWQESGFGLWTLRSKTSEQYMGQGGLRRYTIDDKQQVEIAYVLMPEYWYQGFATEVAKFSVKVAFEVLKLESIVCVAHSTHQKSLKVIQKSGFTYEKDFIHFNQPHVLYRFVARDYVV